VGLFNCVIFNCFPYEKIQFYPLTKNPILYRPTSFVDIFAKFEKFLKKHSAAIFNGFISWIIREGDAKC